MNLLLQKYVEIKIKTAKAEFQKEGWTQIYFELLKMDVDKQNKRLVDNLFVKYDK